MKIDYLSPDHTISIELGQRLARVRKQQGFTQSELAEESGLGVATLRRIEAGQSGQMDSWVKIMKALQMTASIDAFIPEHFDSPRAQVLSGKTHRRKKNNKQNNSDDSSDSSMGSAIKWGDQSSWQQQL